ncbi:MAG: LysE family transporter [Candidatus Thermoplasmatota archaeon]
MELVFFLGMVGFISLSGVLMPGPVFAAAVVKGVEDRYAGAWIAMGHLLVEVPLIFAIGAGFHYIFTHPAVRIVVGLAGGALLLYMGARMIAMRRDVRVVERGFPGHPLVAGIATTLTNPYFFLWWATAGAWLIFLALGYGVTGLAAFIVVHESCDLAWNSTVSYTAHMSRRFWTPRVAWVFGACGALLLVLGAYFIVSVWFV